MRKKSIIALVLLIYISFFPPLYTNQYEDELAAKLGKIMDEFQKLEMFSGVVLLAKEGNTVYEKSLGYADWESKTPNTTSTRFNIGSINKVFTNEMILRLEKEGKLSLNDPLGKYLPLYGDDRDDKITIRMLIDMKAGLNDYLRNPDYNQNIEKFKTVDDYLELIKNEPLLFEPGLGKEYSNSGYVVLGGIIEKITGKSWFDNVKERFITVLGMNNTYFKQIGDNIENCALGTRIDIKGNKISEQQRTMPSPAGGMYMSAADLLKFSNGILKNGLLPSGVRAGGSPVFNAILGHYKNGYTLIILSNFGLAAEEVEMRFRDAMNGNDYPPPKYPMQMELYSVLEEKGISGLESDLKKILESNGFEYNDMHLNMFGYELMNDNQLDKAIEVFTLNTKLFPKIANTWDSLAEAYMNKGDKEKAKMYYKKVLEMQPGNENAKKMLEKLGS
jgi:CubicO group peptidase (beta-lactamase class C family)